MATLQNQSTMATRWRTLDQDALGTPVLGRRDAAAGLLSFTREPGAGYTQGWAGTRRFGLDFEGEFREHQQGGLQTMRYRWLARLGTAARDTVRVTNRLGQAVGVRAFAPDDTLPAAPLLAFTVNAGHEEQSANPLGLPLALSHVLPVFSGGQQIHAGHGDDVELRAGDSVGLA